LDLFLLSQIDIGVPLTNCIIYFLVWFTNSFEFSHLWFPWCHKMPRNF